MRSLKISHGFVKIHETFLYGGCHFITRTSEFVITLWRSCELFLCRDISQVCRTNEISLPKAMKMITTDDHHKILLVLVFMPRNSIIDLISILMVYMYNFRVYC